MHEFILIQSIWINFVAQHEKLFHFDKFRWFIGNLNFSSLVSGGGDGGDGALWLVYGRFVSTYIAMPTEITEYVACPAIRRLRQCSVSVCSGKLDTGHWTLHRTHTVLLSLLVCNFYLRVARLPNWCCLHVLIWLLLLLLLLLQFTPPRANASFKYSNSSVFGFSAMFAFGYSKLAIIQVMSTKFKPNSLFRFDLTISRGHNLNIVIPINTAIIFSLESLQTQGSRCSNWFET